MNEWDDGQSPPPFGGSSSSPWYNCSAASEMLSAACPQGSQTSSWGSQTGLQQQPQPFQQHHDPGRYNSTSIISSNLTQITIPKSRNVTRKPHAKLDIDKLHTTIQKLIEERDEERCKYVRLLDANGNLRVLEQR